MKGALTAVISALALGVLSAAEVSGSNNAIVVEKDIRESSNGWQLLCVPVDGFSIDGTANTIDVNDFLPASYYNEGSKVYILNEDGTTPETASCTLSDGVWSGTTTLTGGQTFWVKNTEESSAGASDVALLASLGLASASTTTTQDPIYFCGQERTRTTLTRPDAGKIALMKNDGASAVTLAELIASPKMRDEILTVQDGKQDYMSYTCVGADEYGKGIWRRTFDWALVTSDATILSGEAFYYQTQPEK